LEPESGIVGRITFRNGKTTYFRNTNFDINSLGSTEIAKDKDFAAFFLSKLGYPVPEGKTILNEELCSHVPNPRNIDDGFTYAQQLGLPVFIKPNSGCNGFLVTKVHTKKEYYRSAKAIFHTEPVLLVQRYYRKNDFRIVVLDDEVISAYQRLPLTVTGDGKSTIQGLLQKKQQDFRYTRRDTVISRDDFRILQKLSRQRLNFLSVLRKGQKVKLLDNANLSAGGEAIEFTEKIHSDWSGLAVEITAKMGLRLCGVDILTDDITVAPTDYIVLEINGRPGLNNYASTGRAQAELVENLYEKVLCALEKR
jgi:D-alanine-D-alanine ligase-like ATP-grasp enzyme